MNSIEENKNSKLGQSILDSVKNKVSPAILTKAVNDWNSQFTLLKRMKSGQKLLKIIGPIAFGIGLEKFLSDEYRPRLIAYNLIDNSENKLIKIINQTLTDKKDLDISIEYNKHENHFLDACSEMKKQARLDLDKPYQIENFIDGILMFIEKDCLENPIYPCQAVLQLSNYLKKSELKESYCKEAVKLLTKKVPANLLQIQTKGLDKWIESNKNISNEEINLRIQQSIKKYKLEGIPNYPLAN